MKNESFLVQACLVILRGFTESFKTNTATFYGLVVGLFVFPQC